MIVVLGEGLDLGFEIAWQEVVFQEHEIVQRLVPALDLARRSGMGLQTDQPFTNLSDQSDKGRAGTLQIQPGRQCRSHNRVRTGEYRQRAGAASRQKIAYATRQSPQIAIFPNAVAIDPVPLSFDRPEIMVHRISFHRAKKRRSVSEPPPLTALFRALQPSGLKSHYLLRLQLN